MLQSNQSKKHKGNDEINLKKLLDLSNIKINERQNDQLMKSKLNGEMDLDNLINLSNSKVEKQPNDQVNSKKKIIAIKNNLSIKPPTKPLWNIDKYNISTTDTTELNRPKLKLRSPLKPPVQNRNLDCGKINKPITLTKPNEFSDLFNENRIIYEMSYFIPSDVVRNFVDWISLNKGNLISKLAKYKKLKHDDTLKPLQNTYYKPLICVAEQFDKCSGGPTERDKCCTEIKKSYDKFIKSSFIENIPKICFIGSHKSGKSSIVGQLIESNEVDDTLIKNVTWAAKRAKCTELTKAWLSDVSENDRNYKITTTPYYVNIKNLEDNQVCLIDCPGNIKYQNIMYRELLNCDKIIWVISLNKEWNKADKSFKNEDYIKNIMRVVKILQKSNNIEIILVNDTKISDIEKIKVVLLKLSKKLLKTDISIIEIKDSFQLTNQELSLIKNKLSIVNKIREDDIKNEECRIIIENIVKCVENSSATLTCRVISGGILQSNSNGYCVIPGNKRLILKSIHTLNNKTGEYYHRPKKIGSSFAGEKIEITNALINETKLNVAENDFKVGSIITNYYKNIAKSGSNVTIKCGQDWLVRLVLTDQVNDYKPIASGVLFTFINSSIYCSCMIKKIVKCKLSNNQEIKRYVPNKIGIQVDLNIHLSEEICFESKFNLDTFILSDNYKIVGVGRIRNIV